jgi:hypothetical protein
MNSSGPISLAGTTAGVSIENELGGNGTTQISLNDTTVRTLAGVASGAITMPTNFYGKSNNTVSVTYVLIGSGGAGGAYCNNYGGAGGGGGGGVVTSTLTFKTCQTYTVITAPPAAPYRSTTLCGPCISIIKAGNGGNGSRTIYRCCGGCLVPCSAGAPVAATFGGGGGGGAAGAAWPCSRCGATPRSGSGNTWSAGGGGGACGCATSATGTSCLNNKGGNGGAGKAVSIFCTTVYFGGGGAGSTLRNLNSNYCKFALGGTGGGGYGAYAYNNPNINGQQAPRYSGGGGGGANIGGSYYGNNGGIGMGIIYYCGTTPRFKGGLIKTVGGKTYHLLRNANGNSMFLSPISGTNVLVKYLAVGGGGGGGGAGTTCGGGGGGGAGGMVCGYLYLTKATTYTITIGAGGSNTCGGPTYLGSYSCLYAEPVGYGGGYGGTRNSVGYFGGSGGGGGMGSTGLPVYYGGAPLVYLDGNYGGRSTPCSTAGAGGGGGGAGANGSNSSCANGGNGGVGKINNITGSCVYYAGGGGGGGKTSNGTGGTGGGGNAGSPNGSNATANTGGGGGGGTSGSAGNGGSGVLVIASLCSPATITGTYTGPTCVGGYKTYKFTGSGTIRY